MGFLSDLAGGLRAAGGVLNPEVQRATQAQDERERLSQQQQGRLFVQQLAKGVADGRLAPEAAQAAAQAKGLNVPIEMFGGISAQAQAAKQKLANEQGFRSALSALPPDATEEQQVQAARPFQSPDQLGSQITASRDRREATALRGQQLLLQVDQKQQGLDRQRDEFNQRTQDVGRRQQFEEFFKTESLKNTRSQNAILNGLKQQGIDLQRERQDAAGGGVLQPDATEQAPAGATAFPSNIDASKGTGGSGFFGGISNTVADMFGAKLPRPEAERAIQSLKNLNVQTITMLQDAVPGRPSKFLLEKLEELAVKPGSLFMGDARSKERLGSTRSMLDQEVKRMEREVLKTPHLFSKKEVSDTRKSHGSLRQLLGEYDQVIRSFDGGKQPARRTTDAPGAVLKFDAQGNPIQ